MFAHTPSWVQNPGRASVAGKPDRARRR